MQICTLSCTQTCNISFHLECPYDYADHEYYLYDDDEELSDDLGDEELRHIDPCHPGAIQETLVTLHQENHSCQTNRDAESDAT